MHKLAFWTLAAASALQPSIASAQTVTPPDRYEGTPQVPLKKPAGASDRTSAAPAPVAQPAPPAPAGITWRNQAATPAVAPLGRPASAPPPVIVRLPAPPPAPITAPQTRRIVIRREPGPAGDGPRAFVMRRDEDAGPVRVIVRARHDDMGPDHRDMDSHHGGMGRHHDVGGEHGRGMADYDGDWSDEGRDAFAYNREDGHGEDWRDGEDDYGPAGTDYGPVHGPAYGYAPGPCCSGGMITETITTTTTYPPTMEAASHVTAPQHRVTRTVKRKLRR